MQSASTILMIRPACFFFNEETGQSNHFQKSVNTSIEDLTEQAQLEFDEFVSALQSHKVNVEVINDSIYPPKPDAVFPNNWISFHENGKVFTYPMQSANRRSERRLEVIQELSKKYSIDNLCDLAWFENEQKFLEGTGSMVLDRVNKIIYAALSPRTHRYVLEQFAQKVNYKIVCFNSLDERNKPIYHTNVMMSIGENFAVVCLESIKNLNERKMLSQSLKETGKEVITINTEQLNAFAGNILQIKNTSGKNFIVMSETANRIFHEPQLDKLRQNGKIISISIPTIEKVGGGSVRCMMAEVFLQTHL